LSARRRLSHPILPTSRTDALNSRARVMAGSRDAPHGLRREPSTTLQPSCPVSARLVHHRDGEAMRKKLWPFGARKQVSHRLTAFVVNLGATAGPLFWELVRKDFELVNLWRLGKQIAGLGLFHQGGCHFALEVRLPPALVIKRVEDGEGGRPFLIANHAIVPGSALTRGTAERRKSATSFSLPGFACSET